ncbi:GNAT family N-acetyltransferase [Bacillus spongiae]|uniref:GNAT family N-acetyltransferase n=1 Tax=Bacillus spongiae TaxID=2683610 RepID=A0ABU8HC49_9BACI
MVTIKRLSECSLQEAVLAWNRGFTYYFADVQMTIDHFLKRLVQEELSPDLSIIAFDGEEPIGIILSGIREINGRKMAWNGGTGVAPTYRGKGIGKELLKEVLAIYREEGVDISTLEAIDENEHAIHLYEKFGYVVEDRLLLLVQEGSMDATRFGNHQSGYTYTKILPQELPNLSIYKNMKGWQTQFNSVKEGEVLIAADQNTEVGYALYKRHFNTEGKHVSTTLYQCEVGENRHDHDDITASLLTQIYAPLEQNIKRNTMNLSATNQSAVSLLYKAGFKKHIEQVWMKKIMASE